MWTPHCTCIQCLRTNCTCKIQNLSIRASSPRGMEDIRALQRVASSIHATPCAVQTYQMLTAVQQYWQLLTMQCRKENWPQHRTTSTAPSTCSKMWPRRSLWSLLISILGPVDSTTASSTVSTQKCQLYSVNDEHNAVFPSWLCATLCYWWWTVYMSW